MTLKSILDSVKQAAGVVAADPETIAMATIALTRYREDGEVLVLDASLETKIVPALEALESVSHAALFGYNDHIRLLVQVELMGLPFEMTWSIKPTDVRWGPVYEFDFEFKLVHWQTAGKVTTFTTKALYEAFSAVVPFGGIFNAIASMSIDQTVSQIGLSRLDGWSGLTDQGVEIWKNCATVDLQAQQTLSPLWSLNPSTSKIQGTLSKLDVDVPKRLVDFFRPTALRATREGLLIAMEISPAGQVLFETAARAAHELQGTGRKLLENQLAGPG